MRKCGICHEEIVPDEDVAIQTRLGYITSGEYRDFTPRTEIGNYHSRCFDKVEFLIKVKCPSCGTGIDRRVSLGQGEGEDWCGYCGSNFPWKEV